MTSNPSLQEGVLWVHNIRTAQSQPSDPARLCVCGSSCVQQLQEMLSLLKSFGLNPVTPKSSQRGLATSLCEPRLLLPRAGVGASLLLTLHDRLCFTFPPISLDRAQWVWPEAHPRAHFKSKRWTKG